MRVLVTALGMIAAAQAGQQFTGVSQAGMEFGIEYNGAPSGKIPGVSGSDWFPPANVSIDKFLNRLGGNVIRLPIAWERVQPSLGGNFSATYMNAIDRVVERVTGELNGGSALFLDLHNYGRYNGSKIGTDAVKAGDFYDVWAKLAEKYKGNENVMFGLMNWPWDTEPQKWWEFAQGAIDAIRATGASNPVVVGGACGGKATEWNQPCEGGPSNLEYGRNITDPKGRVIFDLRQYFNDDNGECTSSPIEALNRTTIALREEKVVAWMAEFSSTNKDSCLTMLKDFVGFLDANSDVWVGWTYWAAGSAWGDWWGGVEPTLTEDKPQAKVFSQYFSGNKVSKGGNLTTNTYPNLYSGGLRTGGFSGMALVAFCLLASWLVQ